MKGCHNFPVLCKRVLSLSAGFHIEWSIGNPFCQFFVSEWFEFFENSHEFIGLIDWSDCCGMGEVMPNEDTIVQ
jgi:hypothetical protein